MLLKVYILGMPTPQMIALYKDIKVTIYVYDKVSVYASHLFYSGKLVKIYSTRAIQMVTRLITMWND